MRTEAKFFDELTGREVYEILKARSQIFMVEENCVYLDMDDRDYESLHVFIRDGGRVSAYLRAFRRDEETVQMGRVLTVKHGMGLGGQLLKEGIARVREIFAPRRILVESRTSVIGFYEREGFRVSSGEFFEVGVAHVQMILELDPQTPSRAEEARQEG